jgi:hypothetical protein
MPQRKKLCTVRILDLIENVVCFSAAIGGDE